MKHWKIWLTIAVTLLLAGAVGLGWWAWTHWATFWTIIWYGFLITTTGTILLGTFTLLHPLDFTVRGRVTPKGQRGEVLFSYFFGWLGLGATASLAAQKVWVRLGRREWPLWKNLRERPASGPKKPGKPAGSAPGAGPCPDTPPAGVTTPVVSQAEKVSSVGANPESLSPVAPPTPLASAKTAEPVPARETSSPPSLSSQEKMPPPETLVEKEQDKITAGTIPEPGPVAPGSGSHLSGSPLPPAAEAPRVEGFEEVKAPPVVVMSEADLGGTGGGGGNTGGPGDGGKAERSGGGEKKDWLDQLFTKMKRWRRTLAGWRRKIREGWKISRNLWRRFSPILWRLGANLWATVSLLGPRLWVRHGLEAPEITGMIHGLVSTLGGLARSFGARLEAVPVFCVQTIYVKGDVGISVSSWRSLYCFLRFLCERDLWKGGLDLYRWHRERQAADKPV